MSFPRLRGKLEPRHLQKQMRVQSPMLLCFSRRQRTDVHKSEDHKSCEASFLGAQIALAICPEEVRTVRIFRSKTKRANAKTDIEGKE